MDPQAPTTRMISEGVGDDRDSVGYAVRRQPIESDLDGAGVAFTMIAEEIDRLAMTVADAEERLTYVLRPPHDKLERATRALDGSRTSALTERVTAHADRIGEVTTALQNLVARLDLPA